MSSWGNVDNAANAPLWAAETVNLSPTSASITQIYDNTQANNANNVAVTLGDGSVRQGSVTYGLFNLDANETQVEDANPTGGYIVHSGWNLVKTGQGGRAGRIQTETLVCLNTVISDSDGQTYANVSITLTSPSNATVTHGSANANTVTFTVTPTLTGNTAANLTYQWQVNNNSGGSWVNMTNGASGQPGGTIAGNVATPTLYVTPWNTTANNYVFRCVVTAADEGVVAYSSNAEITIL